MESRGSSDQEDDQIVHVREALMSHDGENFEGLRTARFLNYTTASINDDVFDLPHDAFSYTPHTEEETEEEEEKISFPAWSSPSLNWIEWVNAMSQSHANAWKRSGVYDAIMSSRYQIKKHEGLIRALIERWCVETNTFVFPWGEATVTLEDMIVLCGFSVIGNNALAPIKKEALKVVEEKMKKAKREIEAGSGKRCSVSSWMRVMMRSGNEIEHEAFVASWLSRFVFSSSDDSLKDALFPASIQIAKGVKLALAPAVLAGIYSDLGVLKEKLGVYSDREVVVAKSPFQFVQVWAFERIMELQPPGLPNQLKTGEPRMARWYQCGGGGQDTYGYPEKVGAVLDSAKESFDYRPYTNPLNNFKFPRFYLEDSCWVSANSDDKNVVAFGRCLRFSKLVGLDCIEPYYPHRVALQFGYDQDVPGVVPARTETPELAWRDYIRPISDEMLYIPARLHCGDVTVGYIRWWKQSVEILQAEAKKISHKLLLASPPRQKHVTKTVVARTTTTMTTTKATSFSPGKGKADQQQKQEPVKKRDTETKQATKHPLKKPEWIQRPSPGLKKIPNISLGGAADDVKDLKGALKSSGGTKGQGHVTFQLPGSSPQERSPSKTHTLSPKPRGSPVKKPRMLPRVAEMAKQSSSSPWVSRQTPSLTKNNNSPSPRVSREEPYKSPSCSGSPLKRKKSPRSLEEAGNSRGNRNLPSPRASKEPYKSPSVSGSSSLTRQKSPRSPEAVTSRGNNGSPSPRASKEPNKSSSSSGSPSLRRKKSPRSSEAVNSGGHSSSEGNSIVKRNTDTSVIAARQEDESPEKTQLDTGMANAKLCGEIVTLSEQVGEEGGEVTYQIPKQQFEDLSQRFQDFVNDLQSIGSALNIKDDDDDIGDDDDDEE